MTTKPGKVVTCNGELSSIETYDLLLRRYSDFDFFLQFVGLESKRRHRLLVCSILFHHLMEPIRQEMHITIYTFFNFFFPSIIREWSKLDFNTRNSKCY